MKFFRRGVWTERRDNPKCPKEPLPCLTRTQIDRCAHESIWLRRVPDEMSDGRKLLRGGKRAEVEKYRSAWRDCGQGLLAVFMQHPRILYLKIVQELLKVTFGLSVLGLLELFIYSRKYCREKAGLCSNAIVIPGDTKSFPPCFVS